MTVTTKIIIEIVSEKKMMKENLPENESCRDLQVVLLERERGERDRIEREKARRGNGKGSGRRELR